jgi:D-alanyl-D-alanine carboxypeptidase (penicillin-binding protein 5/6)
MSKCYQNIVLSILAVIFLLSFTQIASSYTTTAKQALLIDFQTGETLFEKNSNTLMPPASMSKIMTAYIAFEAIQNGHLKLDDKIKISENAWRKGGSKMFVKVNTQVKVADILRGIIVQSGNDAAIALAEHLEGSEEAFAEKMTSKARELGMKNSVFKNATGWPDSEHRMTARDLVTLAVSTINNFPELYPIYSEVNFTYNKIKQGNRNPLLYKGMGADGLKTGHTNAAGYGLTASVERAGRRLILVLNGLKTARQRTVESQRLIEWGFREFTNHKLFASGEPVTNIDVWLGKSKTVTASLEAELVLSIKRSDKEKIKINVKYNEPITAPIAIGQEIGILNVSLPEGFSQNYPLISRQRINRLGPFQRIIAAATYLIWGSGD